MNNFEVRLLYDGHYYVLAVNATDKENAVEILINTPWFNRAKEYEILSINDLGVLKRKLFFVYRIDSYKINIPLFLY